MRWRPSASGSSTSWVSPLLTMRGMLAVLVSRFRGPSVRERDSALCGGNALDAGLVAIAVECGPDAEAGEQSAIAMSCAKSSIDRAALILWTFCWLGTSLLKGIFRAAPRMNFSIALAMRFLRREPARNSLQPPNPLQNPFPPLPLSHAASSTFFSAQPGRLSC